MAIVTSSSFAKALFPGVSAWWGKAYDEWSPQHVDLFDEQKSVRAYEEDVQYTGLGLAAIKREGNSVSFDGMQQGWITRYVPVVYALGFIITREMVEDDLYGVVGSKRAQALAFSMRQTKEQVAANVYNRAFNSAFVGGDGVELLSTAHKNFTGGTYSNKLTTDADLSEAALEQACIDISKFLNDRGLRISLAPNTLHIPVDLMFEAERILMSPYRVSTGDNDINAMYHMGKFPGGIKVNHYFTDTDAWFIRTNLRQDGLKYINRRNVDFAVDNEFDTENAKFKATERYAFGWTDPRALFGSQGA